MIKMDNDMLNVLVSQMGGFGKLKTMIGAYDFTNSDGKLVFKFKGNKKINCIKITLENDDTYTIDFIKIGKFDFNTVSTSQGIYCDMLKPVIEQNINLCLSLF